MANGAPTYPYPRRSRPTTLDCGSFVLSSTSHRFLADYCGNLAEKTSRVSRSVRKKIAKWRRSRYTNDRDRSNIGIGREVYFQQPPVFLHLPSSTTNNLRDLELGYPTHRHHQIATSSCSSWPSEQQQQISYSNLEQHFLPGDLLRLSRYPKSLRDLKYLEIEAILGRDPRLKNNVNNDNNDDDEDVEDEIETDFIRNDETAREPGKVHYEREYRLYGKDTVALIFYKTCYL